MTTPYNYDLTVIDIFKYNCKTHLKSDLISVLAKQHRGLEANIFKSFHFCQPLFEGNFPVTPEWVTRPKLP